MRFKSHGRMIFKISFNHVAYKEMTAIEYCKTWFSIVNIVKGTTRKGKSYVLIKLYLFSFHLFCGLLQRQVMKSEAPCRNWTYGFGLICTTFQPAKLEGSESNTNTLSFCTPAPIAGGDDCCAAFKIKEGNLKPNNLKINIIFL